jgi:UV DNA damage endonuclease
MSVARPSAARDGAHRIGGVRLGLCCQFLEAPIAFRTATWRHLSSMAPVRRRAHLAAIAHHNAAALGAAIRECDALGIGAFRISSGLLPLATHPAGGYDLEELDDDGALVAAFRDAGRRARERSIRLSFHPDQFVVLNSDRAPVVASAVTELEAQSRLADLVGADTICLHGGGAAGGKADALTRLARGIERLSSGARERLALENDDRSFTVRDLLPLARDLECPIVYDAHHHRCNPDGLSIEEATGLAAATWQGREPWAHIASPREGWGASNPRPHAPRVDIADFPASWLERIMTVDVEAKDKERAVLGLRESLATGARPAVATSTPR